MANYFPRSNAEQVTWLTNFSSKIAISGVSLGLTVTEISELQTNCSSLITAINTAETLKTSLKSATAAKEIAVQTNGGNIRNNVARLKTSASYNATMGQDLGVIGTSTALDFATFKAKLTVENFAGYIRLKFTKKGTDGVNIYRRKLGESTWHFLARDTKSPYDDHIVLAVANQPEHWEYRAFGVVDDNEIGIASDIVSVVFGN